MGVSCDVLAHGREKKENGKFCYCDRKQETANLQLPTKMKDQFYPFSKVQWLDLPYSLDFMMYFAFYLFSSNCRT